MQKEYFDVQNVKCNGCIATIQKNLMSLSGVESVQVKLSSPEKMQQGYNVEICGTGLSRDTIITRFALCGIGLLGARIHIEIEK